ncbi:hypothetical protein HRR95_000629 [Exophiala dermatitidis]|nr:hypothetical protein HRR95_000629 [Exophiala dermatitidis]
MPQRWAKGKEVRNLFVDNLVSKADAAKHELGRLLPSPVTTGSNLDSRSLKRKWIAADERSLEEQQRRVAEHSTLREIESEQHVAHWVLTGSWPKNMQQRDLKMPDAASSKRRSSSSHRSQTLERMATHGIYMESSSLIEKDSKNLCEELLKGEYNTVKTSIYTSAEFDRVLDRVRHLNEARIQRDVTPWVVPAAEALIIRGELQNDWIGEELNSEWGRCATLGSTTPKPDYTAGLRRDSFTEEEAAKLENYATPTRPFHFTPSLCFPFLICEAKTGERGLNEADRQNIHSASIAVRALVSLYQEAFGSTAPHRVQQLFGRVLVFTISHDNDRVLLYGHFAVADPKVEGGLKFYRHPIDLFSLSTRGGAHRLKAYNFVVNVYEKFAVDHRTRIKDAVAQLPELAKRTGLSFSASDLNNDPANSTEGSREALSRGGNEFAMPIEPASVAQRRETTKLREQIERLLQQMEQQRLDAKQQMDQQRQDAKQQLEQQRQQLDQQRQQMDQQRQQLEQQLQRQNDIIALLKETRK